MNPFSGFLEIRQHCAEPAKFEDTRERTGIVQFKVTNQKTNATK